MMEVEVVEEEVNSVDGDMRMPDVEMVKDRQERTEDDVIVICEKENENACVEIMKEVNRCTKRTGGEGREEYMGNDSSNIKNRKKVVEIIREEGQSEKTRREKERQEEVEIIEVAEERMEEKQMKEEEVCPEEVKIIEQSERSHEEMIQVVVTHGQGQLWSGWEVARAWSKYRVVGQLNGALPRHPHQASLLGLPLTLMDEEVSLLVEKGLAQTVSYEQMKEVPSEEMRERFQQLRKECYEEQVQAARQQRRDEISNVADTILRGKRKKFEQKQKTEQGNQMQGITFDLTKEQVIEEEMKKIQKLPQHLQVLQIFTQHPLLHTFVPEPTEWPQPTTQVAKLKYAVYKDLWEQQYYLTKGVKFGGDFLVYTGDPHLFHASFVVRCVQDWGRVDQLDLVTVSRTATAARKTLVLAYFNKDDRVAYQSFCWLGDELD